MISLSGHPNTPHLQPAQNAKPFEHYRSCSRSAGPGLKSSIAFNKAISPRRRAFMFLVIGWGESGYSFEVVPNKTDLFAIFVVLVGSLVVHKVGKNLSVHTTRHACMGNSQLRHEHTCKVAVHDACLAKRSAHTQTYGIPALAEHPARLHSLSWQSGPAHKPF